MSSPHAAALAQLCPLAENPGQTAMALELDRLVSAIDGIYDELFPLTAVATLDRWEALYGLDGDGSEEDRRATLMAAYNADVGISQRFYAALAISMGHSVAIKPPSRMCRVGVSHVGQPVYSHDEQWTWTVRTPLSSANAAKLVSLFEAEKIPFTQIRWVYNYFPLLTVSGANVLTARGVRVLLEVQD